MKKVLSGLFGIKGHASQDLLLLGDLGFGTSERTCFQFLQEGSFLQGLLG